jgi:hypothetical protein
VAALAIGPHPRHAHDGVGPEETIEAIIEEVHFKPLANQPEWDQQF